MTVRDGDRREESETPRDLAPFLIGPDSRDHSVLIHGDRITKSEPGMPPPRGAFISLPCEDGRLEAGRANGHTHLYGGLASLGMPPPTPPPRTFIEILERVWWRLDRALDHELLRVAARFYVAESLLAGTTTLVDHHESPSCIEGSLDVLADVCQRLGMRAVLCYGASERNGGRPEAERGLAECRRFLRSNRRPLVRGTIGLHASFTVSDDAIRHAAQLCRELRTVLHLHVAEDGADLADARRRGHAGPLERLEALGALPPGSILAHGVHLDAAEARRVSDAGCWIVQNPRSNRANGVGYPCAIGHAERVALGTDGYPADMEAEADALREEARRHEVPPVPAPPSGAPWRHHGLADLIDGAPEHGAAQRGAPPPPARVEALVANRLAGAARLAGERFDCGLGTLAPGAAADIVAFANGAVRHLVVGGRLVIHEGRLMTGDIDEIRAEAREAAARLWRAMRAS